MKIACLSYYSDFTRYFSSLAIITENVEIMNYCVNLSAYLYKSPPSMHSVFLPVDVRWRKAKANTESADVEWMTEYPRSMGSPVTPINRIAKRYYSYFVSSLEEYEPDLVIISGDTRMQSRAMDLATQRLQISRLYFEQGPNNTTILDTKGVNATASFANNEINFSSNSTLTQ